MSIIYQALKKVEDKGKIRLSNKDRKKKLFIFLLPTISFSLFIVLGSLYFKKKNISLQISSKGELNLDRKKSTPLPSKKYPPNNYILEGIIYDEKTPLAIINGKVLGKQERIDDLELISITPNSVELLNLNDKTKITLTF
jgi:hypothetical protein